MIGDLSEPAEKAVLIAGIIPDSDHDTSRCGFARGTQSPEKSKPFANAAI